MGTLARKIDRQKVLDERRELDMKERRELKEAEGHPAVKYTDDLIAEVESMHKKYPEIQTMYKEQIDTIRNDCMERISKLRDTKREIIQKMSAEFQKVLDGVHADYKEKEFWMFMRGVEYERDEIKDIIKNNYGEETKNNIEDSVE